MKCFISLAFTPPQEVYQYLCTLLSHLNHNNELETFVTYLVKTWIGCYEVLQFPVPQGNNDVLLADRWIRDFIRQNNLENRHSRYPINVWNVCARWG